MRLEISMTSLKGEKSLGDAMTLNDFIFQPYVDAN